MRFPRSSGLLMPVFSLPAVSGIGDLGPCAHRFVDFLHDAEQTIWQMLPLGPPALGNSPYSSYSAFAGNPLLISLEKLTDMGLLPADYPVALDTEPPSQIDYDRVAAHKQAALQHAFATFCGGNFPAERAGLEEFQADNEHWLPDFVLYQSLATEYGEPDWSCWPAELVQGQPAAMAAARDRLAAAIDLACFEQYLFHRQWQELKTYAHERQIRLYGDMPIFVAYESVDVWRNQELFALDANGRPTVVAGVPPDYFSATGQMWGNPLYRWDRLQDSGFAWWLARLQQAFQSFDILRLDHFRGFESYWEIPAGAENAINGTWQPGPQTALFDAARDRFGPLSIVAEDLGLITDEVHQLRETLRFPGMRVLQFGFDSADDPFHRPEAWPEHCFAYTGTHDNETIAGWYQQRVNDGKDNALLSPLLQTDVPVHQSLVQAVMDSAADTVIIPIQDLIGLGNDCRTNTPGVSAGNWKFRCSGESLYTSLSAGLRQMTRDSRRSHRS